VIRVMHQHRRVLGRGFWSLCDQGVVSSGNFLSNVFLARAISSHDYGTFAILFGVLLLLNNIHAALVTYQLVTMMRRYRARVFGEVSQAQLEELIHGIEIEGVRYGAIDANLERRTGRNAWVEMKLTEGKNREVRRVLEHLGLKVSRLIRIAYIGV